MTAIDILGREFGRLIVLGRTVGGRTKWLCRCSCGSEVAVESSNLRAGRQVSCGCFNREIAAARARARGVPLRLRFWDKVDVREPDECWPWMGGVDRDGYGQAWEGSRHVRAPRAAWELCFGPIPDGLLVCHSCDNPPCCNPRDFFLGTTAINMADKIAKARGVTLKGEDAPKAKLTASQVAIIRASRDNQSIIAEQFDVSQSTVSLIRGGQTWRS